MHRIALRVTILVVLLGVLVWNPPPLRNVDGRVSDLLTGWVSHGAPPDDVAIVDIDDHSLEQFGRWPWSRTLLGQMARRTLDSGARLVVFDMMFPEADRAPEPATAPSESLAAAIKGQPAVAGYFPSIGNRAGAARACDVEPLPLAVATPDDSASGAFFHASGAVCTVPEISRAAAGNGFLNVAPDSDGVLRRVPLVIEQQGRYYPSLPLAALVALRRPDSIGLVASAHGASRLLLGDQTISLEGPSLLRLRYRGPRRTFRHLSAGDVLNGSAPREEMRGKIFIVGGSALGFENAAVTPRDPMFPGVEIQATALSNLLHGDFLSRPGWLHQLELGAALLLGLASILLFERSRALWAPLAAVGTIAASWAGCALLLFRTGLLASPLPITVVLAGDVSAFTLINYRRERTRADRTARQLDSAREATREVIEKSESRYQRLVENISEAIVVYDASGRLEFANRRYREWFGLTGKDIGGVAFEDCATPEWRAFLRERRERRMSGVAVDSHCEFEAERADGQLIWIDAQIAAIEKKGGITGCQAALRDVTERKLIEAQYLQAQKMESIGRLAGGVAHDFNNLLTVINGYSDMVLGEMDPQDPNRESLEEIRHAGERAKDLTQNLLAFSRKQLASPRTLNLNQVVKDAAKMFGRLIGEDICFITRLSPELDEVTADPGQLHQAFDDTAP